MLGLSSRTAVCCMCTYTVTLAAPRRRLSLSLSCHVLTLTVPVSEVCSMALCSMLSHPGVIGALLSEMSAARLADWAHCRVHTLSRWLQPRPPEPGSRGGGSCRCAHVTNLPWLLRRPPCLLTRYRLPSQVKTSHSALQQITQEICSNRVRLHP